MDIFYLQMPVNILLITDSLHEAGRFQKYFREATANHNITLHQQYTLSGGLKAIGLLRIDLVVLDNNLSEMNELESLQLILQNYPDLDLSRKVIYQGAQTFLDKDHINTSYLLHAISWSFERKELLKKLEEANNQIGMGYWEIDTKHNIWKNSPSLNNILEHSISSMEQYLKLVHPDDQRRVAMAFMQAVREGLAFELEHRLDLGSPPKRVYIQGQPDLDAHQQVVRLRGEIKHIPTAQRTQQVQRPVVSTATPKTSRPQSTEKFTNIEYLKQVSGGDRMIMGKAISKFIETTPEMLNNMNQLLQDENYDELAKTAHKLKSSVAMMGMEEILKTIKNIEFVSKNRERLDALPVLVNRSRKMIQYAIEELHQELEQL